MALILHKNFEGKVFTATKMGSKQSNPFCFRMAGAK